MEVKKEIVDGKLETDIFLVSGDAKFSIGQNFHLKKSEVDSLQRALVLSTAKLEFKGVEVNLDGGVQVTIKPNIIECSFDNQLSSNAHITVKVTDAEVQNLIWCLLDGTEASYGVVPTKD